MLLWSSTWKWLFLKKWSVSQKFENLWNFVNIWLPWEVRNKCGSKLTEQASKHANWAVGDSLTLCTLHNHMPIPHQGELFLPPRLILHVFISCYMLVALRSKLVSRSVACSLGLSELRGLQACYSWDIFILQESTFIFLQCYLVLLTESSSVLVRLSNPSSKYSITALKKVKPKTNMKCQVFPHAKVSSEMN